MFNRKHKNLIKEYHGEIKSDFQGLFVKPKSTGFFLRTSNILVWLGVALLLALFINAWLILPKASRIYHLSEIIKTDLEHGLYLWTDKDFKGADEKLKSAEFNLSETSREIADIKKTPITWIPYIKQRLEALEGLLAVANHLISTGQELNNDTAEILRLLPDQTLSNYHNLSLSQKAEFWKKIVALEPKLAGAKNDLALINDQLEKIENQKLLNNYQIDLTTIKVKLGEISSQVASAHFFSKHLPKIFGYPETSRYLFVLQNKHELRPTGGFIGTFGIGEVKQGEIIRLTTSDSYHLDMPVKDKLKVTPPKEMAKYLKIPYWYFRDSNWSPDWPTSAQKITWFYQEENKLLPKPEINDDFNFIIGITPDAIIDLLEITGPIIVDGQKYHQDNFMELLQETTEKTYVERGISSWNRKQVIGKITQELQVNLIKSMDKHQAEILNIFKNNLNQKNILIYTEDQEISDYLKQMNWDGSIKATEGDYIMIVDANLAALKTDAVMNRNIDYQLQETKDGLKAKLTINYANTGAYTWKTGKYQSYTRIYVPHGSKLTKAAGFYGDNSDLVIGEEYGKTYFGAYFELEPGKIASLSFDYVLPYNIWQQLRVKQYSLVVQKQPGSEIKDLRLKLNFNNKIKSYTPSSLHAALADNQISWKDNLDIDKEFTVSFY